MIIVILFSLTRRYIVALGTGGIKPNVSTMGADQFDDNYAQDRKEKESFFNWFYWSINLGAFISYTTITYICQYGIPALGGLDWAFFVGYLIPAIMMGLAIFIFWLGTPKYRTVPAQGSALERAFKIAKEALWTRRQVRKADLVAMPGAGSTDSGFPIFNSGLHSQLLTEKDLDRSV